MVVPMRFTKDICRLLGIGSGAPTERREEQMDYGEGALDNSAGDVTLIQDEGMSLEVSLGVEERARRKAEKRRAKKKRQRERKKLEKVKDNEQEEEEEDEDLESESEEEAEVSEPVSHSMGRATQPLAATGNRNNDQSNPSSTEEELEWDVNSAFVANAASHIKPKSRTKASHKSKENKENEAKTGEVNGTDADVKRSTPLAEKGIKLVEQGQYSQAVAMFTEAIKYDPKDYRFFGNRSYCYECVEQYNSALADAEISIQLAADWPKGYFRKGRALMGMKRYGEAVKALSEVLKLDQNCEDAVNEIFNCRVLHLMELGFNPQQSVLLLDRFTTVQGVLTSPEAAKVVTDLDSLLDQSGNPCASLWVGNVTVDVKEKQLRDLFKSYGEIDSIRVLHERFCAFVNFVSATAAATAMEKLQGKEIESTRLVIRYPDRRPQRDPASPQRPAVLPIPVPAQPAKPQSAATSTTGPRRRGPVHRDECYFWRTTGCHFGDKCRFKHIPDHRGRDKKPWQT
ncbi:hsp70-Hsp90 organizing protein 1-like [Polyodon spathula]|uniref:hsp70-Hsp90 organizing protein 1-like n=1 Tax=Polyodon spathula TaxID=7913 RepID=UPI001B7DA448|nr:hsp70-Hsp90 organizing protein 1-like [Polyodon spathula]